MKKILLTILLLLPFSANALEAYKCQEAECGSPYGEILSFVCDPSFIEDIGLYSINSETLLDGIGCTNTANATNIGSGTFLFIQSGSFPLCTNGLSKTDCIDSTNSQWVEAVSDGTFWTEFRYRTTLPFMVKDGENAYASSTGGNLGDDTSFVADSFIKLFMGSGLSVLYELRYWILAIVIIYLIVFFMKRTHNAFGKY